MTIGPRDMQTRARGTQAAETIAAFVAHNLDGVTTHDVDRASAGRTIARWSAAREAPRVGARPWRLAGALALGTVAAALLYVYVPRETVAPFGYVVAGAERAGPSAIVAGGDRASVAFTDGSSIRLVRGARAEMAVARRGEVRVGLRGRARFDVHKAAETRWTVAAGPFSVHVTGTRFEVSWSEETERFELAMHEGAVRVTGPGLASSVVVKGQERLVLDAAAIRVPAVSALPPPAQPPADPAALPADTTSVPNMPRAREVPRAAAPRAPRMSSRSWTARVAAGDFAGVLGEARAQGVSHVLEAAAAADLSALADAARFSGDSRLAERVLRTQRARFKGTRRAAAAAFLLGRVIDERGGDAASAIAAYDAYLSEQPRGALAPEAAGLRLIALPRAGRPRAEQARDARAYLERYPGGPHAAVARRLLGDL